MVVVVADTRPSCAGRAVDADVIPESYHLWTSLVFAWVIIVLSTKQKTYATNLGALSSWYRSVPERYAICASLVSRQP